MHDIKNIKYAEEVEYFDVADSTTANTTKDLFFEGERAFFKKDYASAARSYRTALEAYTLSPGAVHELDYSQMAWYFLEAAFLAGDFSSVVELGQWLCSQMRVTYNIATLRLKIAEAKFELGDLDGSLSDFAYHEKIWGDVPLLNKEDKKYRYFLLENGIKTK